MNEKNGRKRRKKGEKRRRKCENKSEKKQGKRGRCEPVTLPPPPLPTSFHPPPSLPRLHRTTKGKQDKWDDKKTVQTGFSRHVLYIFSHDLTRLHCHSTPFHPLPTPHTRTPRTAAFAAASSYWHRKSAHVSSVVLSPPPSPSLSLSFSIPAGCHSLTLTLPPTSLTIPLFSKLRDTKLKPWHSPPTSSHTAPCLVCVFCTLLLNSHPLPHRLGWDQP